REIGIDVKGLPVHLSARMRTVVGSMGHLFLAPAIKDEPSLNDGVDTVLAAGLARVEGGGEETLDVAADLATTATRDGGPALSAQAQADTALVRRVQQGDMAAFEELFHKYSGVIYRTAL